MPKPKTSEAQRRAVANYQDKVDRVNCRFPKGTKERIEDTGSSINAFIIQAVDEKLARVEKPVNETIDDDLPDFMKE